MSDRSSNLVTRLRDRDDISQAEGGGPDELSAEAADEIERLRHRVAVLDAVGDRLADEIAQKRPVVETPKLSLPVITLGMYRTLADGRFFESTAQPTLGIPGISWSQEAVDFACLLQSPVTTSAPTVWFANQEPPPAVPVWDGESGIADKGEHK